MKNPKLYTAAMVAASFACAAQAANYSVEPDDYTGSVTDAAPHARLVTVRNNATFDDYIFQRAYSVEAGTWAPTGKRVFGNLPMQPGDLAYHWDNVSGPGGAYDCYAFASCGEFKVFGVYFRKTASSVEILTTMRGEQAMDPVVLWAFDKDGNLILKCEQSGVDNAVLQSGDLPPPYYVPLIPSRLEIPCGGVKEVKNCDPSPSAPYNCDYVVKMYVQQRHGPAIAFVWFGGKLWDNTHANVDRLSYTIP